MSFSLQLHGSKSARVIIFLPAFVFTILSFILGSQLHLLLGISLGIFFATVFFYYRSRIIDKIEIKEDMLIHCDGKIFREALVVQNLKIYKVFGNPIFVISSKAGKYFPSFYFGSCHDTSRGSGLKVIDELRCALGHK
jgi:hypothetical protein